MAGELWRGVGRRLSQAAVTELKTLFTRPNRHALSAWSVTMTLVLLALPVFLLVLYPFDAAISRSISANIPDFGLDMLRWLTNLASTKLWLLITALVWLWTALSLPQTSHSEPRSTSSWPTVWHQWSGFMIVAILIASIPVEIGKLAIGRARPALLDSLGAGYFAPFRGGILFESFPSGHAMMAGILLLAVWLWLPRWRFFAVPFFVLLAFSRVAVAAHYLTDIMAGFTIGCLVAWWLGRFLRARNIIF